MPALASKAANTPARPDWPAATAFHIERWPVRAWFSALFGTTAIDRHSARPSASRPNSFPAPSAAPMQQKFAQSKPGVFTASDIRK